jgi:putative DNA primase/helicase
MALGIDEKHLGGKHCPCPICGGHDRFRFDDREGRGTYFCSGCGAGDGMQLAMAYTGKGFRELAQEVERLAGVVQPVATKPGRSDADKRAALRRVFAESKPIQRGDKVSSYLAGRGLALHDLPTGLRLHPALAYFDAGKLVGKWPAMLGIVTGPDGKALSIHRTYIQDCTKAHVSASKKLMQGYPLAGGAIRLTPVSERLGIAEGIETALAADELFEMPVWACISTAGMESFEPPENVKHVVIFADHDLNFAGQSAAYRAAHRLALKGIEVEVIVPPAPGDWLDELNRRKGGAPPPRAGCTAGRA